MERWATVKRLHQAALEREASQRRIFLDEACAGDEALRRDVKSLLAYQEGAEPFLESPALEVTPRTQVIFSVPASVPKPGPRTIHRQPTPTKLSMKNGPEIIDFRPVL